MKKVIMLMTVSLLLLLANSCDNAGFPRRVRFPRSGGMKEVRGHGILYNLHIRDSGGHILASAENQFTGNQDPERPDSIIISYDWLTVKTTYDYRVLTLIADPEKRTNQHLIVGMMDADANVDIVVSME